MTQETLWITGASSGIGRALAKHYANAGCRVIASARNTEALNELAASSENIETIPFDVTCPTSIAPIRDQLASAAPTLDRVIINAGHCEYLQFPAPDWRMIDRVLAVNFLGAVHTVEIALPLLRRSSQSSQSSQSSLRQQGHPHIVAITSQVVNAPFAKAEAYGASKAAGDYFFNSLRIDLAPENIDVTVIQPGFVDTPMTRKNDFAMPFLMDVDSSVKRIVEAISRRPRRYAFPKRLSALLKLSVLMPGVWQKMVTPTPAASKTKQDDTP